MLTPENNSVSTTALKRVIVAIILLIVLIEVGFYRTYIQHFPQFKDYAVDSTFTQHFNWVMHFHGIVMMGWVGMLFIQPILILKGKTQWHRRLGSFSYVLAPLVVFSIFLANRDGYLTFLPAIGKPAAVGFVALTFPGLVFFAVLYALAIIYRKNRPLHMRFMCSTAFLLINPALDRFLETYMGLPGFHYGSTMVIALVALITLVDSVRTKRLSAFTLVFAFVIIHRVCWELKDTPYWQTIGNEIVKLF
jgi:uncharacterized membrane protein YozB (DUF420 family)